jgi:hypothetical protein
MLACGMVDRVVVDLDRPRVCRGLSSDLNKPEPQRGVGSGGLPKNFEWPAHGWHEFRDPNEEWELLLATGADQLRRMPRP